MPSPLLLDSNILSKVVHPSVEEHRPVAAAIQRLLEDHRFVVFVPEVTDYELRRKLLHIGHRPHQGRKWAREALINLDQMASLGYLPLTTETMRLAASLWAQTRSEGRLRGPEESLDIDIILVAQARQAGGQIVTTNEKHFWGIADLFDWRSFQP
ncbi:MAG: PIN domain-containing protein [Thermoanaerobaculia bacterium]